MCIVKVVTSRLSKMSTTIKRLDTKNSYFSISSPPQQPAGVTSSSHLSLINSRLQRLIEAHQLSELNTAPPSLMAAGLQLSGCVSLLRLPKRREVFYPLPSQSQQFFVFSFFFFWGSSQRCTAGTSDEPEQKIKQQQELPPTTFHCLVRLQSPTEGNKHAALRF